MIGNTRFEIKAGVRDEKEFEIREADDDQRGERQSMFKRQKFVVVKNNLDTIPKLKDEDRRCLKVTNS